MLPLIVVLRFLFIFIERINIQSLQLQVEENLRSHLMKEVFDKNNLISGLHTFFSKEDEAFKNILPPLRLLNQKEEKKLMQDLKDLNFKISTSMAA